MPVQETRLKTGTADERFADVGTQERGLSRTGVEGWQARENGLSRGLGWFSLGLGLAQVVAPRAVAILIGVRADRRTRNTLVAIGMREIAAGVGILTRPRTAGWVWTRVVGDVIDLALLGSSIRARYNQADGSRLALSTAATVGITALDVITAQRLSRGIDGGSRGLALRGQQEVTRSIVIDRPAQEIYQFWRNIENLPRFMTNMETVVPLDERRFRLTVKTPLGTTAEWEGELIDERPNERIAWRARKGSHPESTGSVQFMRAPGDRGTQVTVHVRYVIPGGRIGTGVAKLLHQGPETELERDLRQLKQIMEVGEVVHSDASIHSGRHPARPPESFARPEEAPKVKARTESRSVTPAPVSSPAPAAPARNPKESPR